MRERMPDLAASLRPTRGDGSWDCELNQLIPSGNHQGSVRQSCATNKSAARLSQRGGALLAVLWLSAGLAAIAFSVSSTVRSETDRVSTSGEGLRAHYLAEGAVERGILWLNWGYTGFSNNRPDGSTRFWKVNQSRLIMSFPSGDAIVEVIPEKAKLDINHATPEDLYRVVLAVSGDPNRSRQIADAIVDWRSPVQGDPATQSQFDLFYRTIAPTFRARHASIQEIEELLLVQGMTPELFYGNYTADPAGRLFARGGLRDCLSPWGSLGPFDVNSMSPALMEAVGLSPDAVTAVLARRQQTPFTKIQEFRDLTSLAPRIAIGGGVSIYSLRATARLRRPDGTFSDVVRTAGATIRLTDAKRQREPVVLRWYDDAWSQGVIPPFAGMPAPGGNVPGQPGFIPPMQVTQ